MKKFILMGLTIIAFSFVGCGKSDEDKCKEDSTKEWKDGQCVEKGEEVAEMFIITNKLTAAVTLESGDKSLELAKDACAKVEKADFDNLKVSAAGATSAVCDNADTANKCPEADHYEVAEKAGATGENELKKVDKPEDDSSCKELAGEADPEYTINNLLDEAVTVSVGALSATLIAASGTPLAADANGMGCVKVKKSQLANLKIVTGATPPVTVCDNADVAKKCAEGNLQVKAAGAEAASSADENCKAELK